MGGYWLADPDGVFAPAADVKDRDRLATAGWTPAGEPGPADKVWTQHEVLGSFAAFAVEVLPVWQARGWQPAAPPMVAGDVGPVLDLTPRPPTVTTEAEPPSEKPKTDKEKVRG